MCCVVTAPDLQRLATVDTSCQVMQPYCAGCRMVDDCYHSRAAARGRFGHIACVILMHESVPAVTAARSVCTLPLALDLCLWS